MRKEHMSASRQISHSFSRFDRDLFQLLPTELHWFDEPERVGYQLRQTDEQTPPDGIGRAVSSVAQQKFSNNTA